MSKMAELDMQIRDLLMSGSDPVTVARFLEIPVVWVYETNETLDEKGNTEVFSPFSTINS